MFKFKDLYVALTPETSDAGHKGNLLYFNPNPIPANPLPPTVDTQQCKPYPGGPGGGGGTTPCCGGHFSMVALFLSPESVELQEYLVGQLATQELTEVPIQESQNLQTFAEIEALEQKLNGALGELQNRKADLQKKAAVTK